MKEVINLKYLENVAYITPEVHVCEIGIEDSILIVSGKIPPSMGYDDEGWS